MLGDLVRLRERRRRLETRLRAWSRPLVLLRRSRLASRGARRCRRPEVVLAAAVLGAAVWLAAVGATVEERRSAPGASRSTALGLLHLHPPPRAAARRPASRAAERPPPHRPAAESPSSRPPALEPCPVPAGEPSRALGHPWAGKLAGGRLLPEAGEHFFTWDPVRRTSPNPCWRRYGTDRLLATLELVISDYARARPDAPRVGVGDLSRPRGGDFGPRFGRPGHASHRNGLDADVYYPRLDRLERPPRHPEQIDRGLAQALVDNFVAAGARFVFVGPRTRLRGPRRVVQVLPRYHDNHLHVRITG